MSADQMKRKTKHTTAESIANTFEWLITAFVLAFVFRAFVLEAFRIPTGSMADTLMGDHFRIRCSQCGHSYDFNFDPRAQKMYKTAVGGGKFRLKPNPRCSNCGYYEKTNTIVPKSNGDRILVFKCIYQFVEPKRWDVIVFKNPTNPSENYIKRLIAKPGETVEIIDGDIYIDGRLKRKPEKVQQEIWMPIYNNDYQPIRPKENRFNNHGWRQPFTNDQNSQWKSSSAKPTVFTLDSDPKKINIMFYDTQKGNDFKATYAYSNPRFYDNLPVCSDLMMKFYAAAAENGSTIGIGLTKYETLYKAFVDSTGIMTIAKVDATGQTTELISKPAKTVLGKKPVLIKFANADRLLVFEFGQEKLTFDIGAGKDDAGPLLADIEPKAIIFGSGKLAVSHISLYRDIHYLSIRPDTKNAVLRAGQNNPFTLGSDEYFVLGDNSPDSADSRLWPIEGIGNNGKTYRMGIVPKNYLVGKAFFVYWPSGFRIGNFKLPFIPNAGRLRFIHGG